MHEHIFTDDQPGALAVARHDPASGRSAKCRVSGRYRQAGEEDTNAERPGVKADRCGTYK